MTHAILDVDGVTHGDPGLAGIGFMLTVDDGRVYRGGSFIGETSHSVASFNALIWGLENAKAAGVDGLHVHMDDDSVAQQVNGVLKVRNEGLKPLYAQVLMLRSVFPSFALDATVPCDRRVSEVLAVDAIEKHATLGEFLRRPTVKQSIFDMTSAPTVTDPEPVLPVPDAGLQGGGRCVPEVGEEVGPSLSTLSPERTLRAPETALAATPPQSTVEGPHEIGPVARRVRAHVLAGPKTVLVGVTGCIAAYKACEVVRSLQKAGVRVKVVMTANATRFVGPATFKALTGEPVAVSLFDAPGDPIHHISLAKEADLFLVVPCTANVMAKIARGQADDLLTTTALATRAPLLIAPAMNVQMWEAPATRENLSLLSDHGVHMVDPISGRLACGDEGAGKLASVDDIVERALALLSEGEELRGRRLMVTAGPTFEPIDPVRFIGNHSSGKMGYAIAAAAARRGAQVTLVSGPTALSCPVGVDRIEVQTAGQMLEACCEPFDKADAAVFCAAVADFTPRTVCGHKVKKSSGGMPVLELEETADILATLAADKDGRYVVGFAAETDDVVAYAQGKLASKNADLIVANDVSAGKAFAQDTDKVWFVDAAGAQEFPEMSKGDIAEVLVDRIIDELAERDARVTC